ncbi:MAG: hypothetical protein A3B89_03290 [Candidatus Buchananbacteria bacterium RIFCSPHIGHO2_02_FULL_40_13]|uniref:Type II secretion system protein GspH n=1 Tax=Candidatus Buchananbacteria bacterium RIFCSPLOWO2_01_FULL_39_33 TaxID=1797543 RepID=A0A1G1YI92_9BACT|nr:MAG: hypothetical protein A2820_01535 [Candidatus Buchananbacteria bacterium RIFCSPHIGHO2_01_FULL_40_35]OGY50213.1 MAG: hypothetical protein A3B89_03290 [Candidatus Buchananbacteria bacterium RIFCSPHIGHO2_02_FULL_40_13]OGY51430.1 MAG: hypothetical protein A3A02_04555 [Candidatus Buchananbacteria bacterium RIFCSPLOWO2_01_FULL_39_33]
MFYKFKNNNGFTLAEMMIVIAIIGIFSSLTIINFRGQAKVRELNSQALLLLDGLKRMQTSSLTGQMVAGEVPTAYLFEINDCPSDCFYSLRAETALGGEIDIDNVLLTKSIIDLLTGNNLLIKITPPRSNIEIDLDGAPLTSVEIILKHLNDPSITKKIKINGISGRMDIISP